MICVDSDVIEEENEKDKYYSAISIGNCNEIANLTKVSIFGIRARKKKRMERLCNDSPNWCDILRIFPNCQSNPNSGCQNEMKQVYPLMMRLNRVKNICPGSCLKHT